MKIKEYFQNLVKAGVIPQEPANYDAATLKIYIDHLENENAALRNEADENAALSRENKMRADRLETENAALRERLEKAILNKCVYYINSVWNDATMTRKKEICCGTVDYACDKFVEIKGLILNCDKIYFTREDAEAAIEGEQHG